MKKLFLLLLFVVHFLQSFASAPPTLVDKSALLFFKSLVSSIESVKGRSILFLNDGFWKTRMGATNVIWTVEPLTKMIIDFDYNNGILIKAKIKFKKPVFIKVLGTNCTKVQLDSLSFENDGSVSDNPGIRVINGPCNSPTIVNIIRGLTYSTKPQDIF